MRKFPLAASATLVVGLVAAGCTGDDPVRPDVTSPSYARSSTSQGLARVKRVGDPIWRPVDFHLFTAPIGSPPNFAGFAATTEALLPPPNHEPDVPLLGIGPGAPHAPPYDRELAAGVAASGFVDRHSFPASAFSGENGVWLAWMTVPDPGVTGRSPDFASGPIIPNSLFPIEVDGIATRNGEAFDPALIGFVGATEVPPLDERVAPRFAGVEGHSHFPFFTVTAQLFGPANTPLTGRYRYEITMRDQAGNGWDITAQFVVRKKG
jgi:hypothetical protein